MATDVLRYDPLDPAALAEPYGAYRELRDHDLRLQARVALEALLARHPHVGVDVDRGERVLSSFSRAWASLPATGLPATGLPATGLPATGLSDPGAPAGPNPATGATR